MLFKAAAYRCINYLSQPMKFQNFYQRKDTPVGFHLNGLYMFEIRKSARAIKLMIYFLRISF